MLEKFRIGGGKMLQKIKVEKGVTLIPVCTDEYRIIADWKGENCQLHLISNSQEKMCLDKIAVFKMEMPFAPETPVYGEGYNKLSQYKGVVKNMEMLGGFGDFQHYRLPRPEGFQQVYNMVRFAPDKEDNLLMGFTSCYRFNGEFWFDERQLQVILNLEGIEILPYQTIALESFFAGKGKKPELEERFARAIQKNHPMLKTEQIPTGWCSWLVYGPAVSAKNIYDNLEAIKRSGLDLKYIQVDDGYQPYMGDWLSATDAFDGGIKKMCLTIKEKGFEPAIWIAPFIAEEKSEVFQMHPDWFIKDKEGKPLPSDKVSFGGWRCAPWYMLDATNPQVRQHLTTVFRTMREEWNVKYFKMDANMWGALPFGERFDKQKTCVEAYRMGMEAILEGAGYDSFLLGCNAPMWPSLGVVHGMRVTTDNDRSFSIFSGLTKQCFTRNWQHNRLWINDPDTVILRNRDLSVIDPSGNTPAIESNLTRNEFLFNATYILASGGMVLSGDDITEFTEQNVDDLKKLLPPKGMAAVFDTDEYTVGRIRLSEEEILCIFNREDIGRDFLIELKNSAEIIDFWTGEKLGVWNCGKHHVYLEDHSARALRLIPQK